MKTSVPALTVPLLVPSACIAADVAVDSTRYPGAAWSPFLVGGLIGVLSWLTFYFSAKPIGASSCYATLAGLIGKALAQKHTSALAYYRANPPALDWETVFVLTAVAGAFLAAVTGDEWDPTWLPAMWQDRFGPDSLGGRVAATFGGGVLMAFGARLAGGCTSGHGISGALQLSVGSWIAVAAFFAGGMAVAWPIYR